VVIPALNEQPLLERALRSTEGRGVDRVVVDGGSTDGTVETARFLGAEKILVERPGRAGQMDAGYRASGGQVVLFLHADSRLEPGWDSAVRKTLADSRAAGGVFRLCFDSPRPVFRFIERGARVRARLARLPYGDQGIFVRRELLDRQGGIPDTPLFEDLDLIRSIRRAGRLVLLPNRCWTSTRRYERNGPIRTVVRHGFALAAYFLGLNREAVARWYRRQPAR
jgi:rSAM/selenodomain-associated transferase 2